MKITTQIKKVLLAAATSAVVVLSVGMGTAHAAQIPYNDPNNQPILTPKFNTYTDVPGGIGNEADFVTLRKSSGDPTVPAVQNNFIDPVNDACAVGAKFDIRSYIHNGANTEYNNNGSGSAVAHNVNVALTAQLGVTKKNFTFGSTVSASNTASVIDTGTLNCANDAKLRLVASSVHVYSKSTGWNGAPDSAVNGNLRVGSRVAGSGDQWGCWDDRIIVVYTVEVVTPPTPPAPVYTCDLLTVERIGEKKYRYNLTVTAKNGATFKNATYNFGDNNSQVAGKTVDHQYQNAGTFTTVASPVFTVDGHDVTAPTNPKCSVTIKTTIPPENCPIPGKENLPKNSPDCQEQPTVVVPAVTTLPSTGIGGIATGLIGTSGSAYAAYAWLQKRRALKSLK